MKMAAILAFLGLASLGPAVRAEPLPDVEVSGANPSANLDFPCGGLSCRGSLYLPPGRRDSLPVIVMAHGLTLTREYLAVHAHRFAQAGFAVFTFDYRSFGGSEGSPRYDVAADRQLEDWRAAIAFVTRRADIDASRIGLWGSSYSGGHVLVLASESSAIRAVVAQVPYVGASVEDDHGAFFMVKAVAALTLDGLLRLFGSSFEVDVAGEPGKLAGITIAEERESLERFVASVPNSNWRNRMPARVLYRVSTYVPDIRPTAISCPVRLYAADQDRITPAAAIRELASQIPRAELRLAEGGHFDIYAEPQLSKVVEEQIGFYTEQLQLDRGE